VRAERRCALHACSPRILFSPPPISLLLPILAKHHPVRATRTPPHSRKMLPRAYPAPLLPIFAKCHTVRDNRAPLPNRRRPPFPARRNVLTTSPRPTVTRLTQNPTTGAVAPTPSTPPSSAANSASATTPAQVREATVTIDLGSVAVPDHPDREILDLLFFPTGGGKTEAYLWLAAFVLALRRLRDPSRSSPRWRFNKPITQSTTRSYACPAVSQVSQTYVAPRLENTNEPARCHVLPPSTSPWAAVWQAVVTKTLRWGERRMNAM